MVITKFIAVLLIGYVLGSIPFGVIISKWLGKKDIREYGSGKIGATNVLRTAGKKAFAAAALLDLLKGMLSVFFAGLIVGRGYLVVGNVALGALLAQALAALAAIAGHIWPIFLKFKGGRGVATYLGGLIALCPAVALFGGEIWIIGAGLTRYASLGSIAGVVGTYAILVPLTIFHGFPLEYLIYTLVGAVTVVYMHRDNIKRLITGKERKLGEKADKREDPVL